jgi:hypothetical protein
LTDIAILCMPVTQVLKLQVSNAQRASLIFMFLLGGLSVSFQLNLTVFATDWDSQCALRQLLPLCDAHAIRYGRHNRNTGNSVHLVRCGGRICHHKRMSAHAASTYAPRFVPIQQHSEPV